MAFSFQRFILNLIFPVVCLGCGKENGGYLCTACFARLKFCGKKYKLPNKNLSEILIAADYNNPLIASLIKALKFKSIAPAAPILADFLSLFWQGRAMLEKNNFIVIPIPLSKKRKQRRGFNQAELIARNFAANFGYAINCELVKIRNTKAQSELSEQRRAENVAGAFKWRGESLKGCKIILIDDVITTGATINEAADELQRAGAAKIIALAVAKG